MMKIFDINKILILGLLMSVGFSVMAGAARPNVIVIYTDDQGYGDVGALNPKAKFETPNMDRLAKEGIAFTNGHSADSVCTPSRYALLTGRYSWRTERKSGVMGSEGKCLIADGRLTLASMFKEHGYHTAMVGKWHLGMDFPGKAGDRDWSQPVKDMPLDKGFDYFYGVPASLNYGILAWFEGRHAKVPPTMRTSKKKNPLYLDYRIMPPYQEDEGGRSLEVAPDFIDNQCLTRFTDKAIAWMEGKVADARSGKPFFLYLPYTSPHYPVCPLPEFHGQGKAGAYGEFVIETDHHVGRILDFLKSAELEENTLVVFTSDNGPENSWQSRMEETGHDSRGGFREGKRSPYEGGHRVPFLMRWPAGIAEPGRRWDGVVGQVDLLATFAAVLGADLPDQAGEDSQSFAAVLREAKADYRRLPLINHGNGGGENRYTITEGDWKLLLPVGGKDVELYNLAEDLSEEKNLAKEEPEIVAELKAKITRIVLQGRTTPGAPQPNDTGYWKDLTWLGEADFTDAAVRIQAPAAERE
jgi:arylsulfatase A